MGSHKAAGDSLTPFQEYRGFILDGGGFDGAGANGHAGGHKRLSPAYKELLLEVDQMADVAAMPTPTESNSALSAVVKGFSDATHGAGIRAYWVIDDVAARREVFANDDAAVTWAKDYRNSKLDEFVHVMLAESFRPDPQLSGASYGHESRSRVGAFIFTATIKPTVSLAYYPDALATTAAHEITHLIINPNGTGGFDANEHETDPDPRDGPLGHWTSTTS